MNALDCIRFTCLLFPHNFASFQQNELTVSQKVARINGAGGLNSSVLYAGIGGFLNNFHLKVGCLFRMY